MPIPVLTLVTNPKTSIDIFAPKGCRTCAAWRKKLTSASEEAFEEYGRINFIFFRSPSVRLVSKATLPSLMPISSFPTRVAPMPFDRTLLVGVGVSVPPGPLLPGCLKAKKAATSRLGDASPAGGDPRRESCAEARALRPPSSDERRRKCL